MLVFFALIFLDGFCRVVFWLSRFMLFHCRQLLTLENWQRHKPTWCWRWLVVSGSPLSEEPFKDLQYYEKRLCHTCKEKKCDGHFSTLQPPEKLMTPSPIIKQLTHCLVSSLQSLQQASHSATLFKDITLCSLFIGLFYFWIKFLSSPPKHFCLCDKLSRGCFVEYENFFSLDFLIIPTGSFFFLVLTFLTYRDKCKIPFFSC